MGTSINNQESPIDVETDSFFGSYLTKSPKRSPKVTRKTTTPILPKNIPSEISTGSAQDSVSPIDLSDIQPSNTSTPTKVGEKKVDEKSRRKRQLVDRRKRSETKDIKHNVKDDSSAAKKDSDGFVEVPLSKSDAKSKEIEISATAATVAKKELEFDAESESNDKFESPVKSISDNAKVVEILDLEDAKDIGTPDTLLDDCITPILREDNVDEIPTIQEDNTHKSCSLNKSESVDINESLEPVLEGGNIESVSPDSETCNVDINLL